MMIIAIIKIFVLSALSFVVAMSIAPFFIRLLRRFRLGKQLRPAAETPVFSKLHAAKAGTPTMGGVLVWGTAAGLSGILALLAAFVDGPVFQTLSFLSRKETYLPLAALVAAAFVGALDDLFNIRRIGPSGGGLRMRHRLILYTLIAAIGAGWFYFKLEWDILRVPFFGDVSIGLWYIPLFLLVITATAFSVNEIDGLDGLAGGTLLAAFAAYGAIAFVQGKVDLAAFCGVIVGALLAFLWYNINPAQFFMGDTGAMSLGVTLGVVAMLTNSALLLPLIGVMFVLESLSVLTQLGSRKLFGRKVFRSAPLHHHLEAIGWTEPQIVMRFWVIASVAAVIGLILALLDIVK